MRERTATHDLGRVNELARKGYWQKEHAPQKTGSYDEVPNEPKHGDVARHRDVPRDIVVQYGSNTKDSPDKVKQPECQQIIGWRRLEVEDEAHGREQPRRRDEERGRGREPDKLAVMRRKDRRRGAESDPCDALSQG